MPARAIDHEEEVQEFLEILDKCSSDVFAVLHDRHVAAEAVVPPVQAPATARAPPKAPTSELKPEKLTYDSSMVNYQSWENNLEHTSTRDVLTHCLARNSRHSSTIALMKCYVRESTEKHQPLP